MNHEKIGKFIAGARNQAGFTQKELAEQIGVSDKTVSKWECEKNQEIFFVINNVSDESI